MVRQLVGLAVAGAISISAASAGSSAINSTQQLLNQLNGVSPSQITEAFGISKSDYQCAFTALSGKTPDQIISVIKSIQTMDINNPTVDQQNLIGCVHEDPFFWGTNGYTDDELLSLDMVGLQPYSQLPLGGN
jgi:hypothetical protein